MQVFSCANPEAEVFDLRYERRTELPLSDVP